jgi:uncharacterized membrane protein
MSGWQRAGLVFVFAWFFVGGIAHFLEDEFFVRIVPSYVQAPETAVMISGIFEILGAIGLLLPAMRRLAGICLFLLTLVVTAANINMWVHFDQFPEFPPVLLGLRMMLQVFLLALILWVTQPQAGMTAQAA